jgi:hypothetical protein
LRQRFHRRDHVFLISAVERDAADLSVRAIHEIPATAGKTSPVLPAMPTDSNALALPPLLDARAEFIDYAGHLVAWDAWVRDSRQKALLGDHIAVTDSASLHANPHLSRTCFGNFGLHDFNRLLLSALAQLSFSSLDVTLCSHAFVAHLPALSRGHQLDRDCYGAHQNS